MSETEAETTPARTGQFLIMGGNRWGAGDTVEVAKKNFRIQGGKLTGGYALITFDAQTEFHGVDQFGRYHFKGNSPTVTEVKGRK